VAPAGSLKGSSGFSVAYGFGLLLLFGLVLRSSVEGWGGAGAGFLGEKGGLVNEGGGPGGGV
jgi:hypothetical protein